MNVYGFKHEKTKSLYALSTDKTGANIPDGPWKFWKNVTIRPTGVIGYDPVEAANDIAAQGWHIHCFGAGFSVK